MNLYPAIDLLDGKCVRLIKGDIKSAITFNDDPTEQARIFARVGCEWLHIIDINGAHEGRPVNSESVLSIIRSVDLSIQIGGGIRNIGMIEFWMDNGINRVILGTAAVRDPLLVRQACEKFPGKIAVSVDAVNGIVAVDGWTETTKISVHSICTDLEKIGVSAIIFTDIDRDGTLKGPNIESTRDLASRVKMPVILSGGVSSLEDLRELKEKAPMLEGVICGRALYDGRLDPAAAVALLRGK